MYPARAESYALCLAVFLGFDKGASIDLSRGYVQAIQNKLPSITGKCLLCSVFSKNQGLGGRYYVASALFTGVVWVGWVLIIRYILKGLFSYQGWMMEGRGKKSLTTRIWGALVWLFSGRHPLLYSYQGMVRPNLASNALIRFPAKTSRPHCCRYPWTLHAQYEAALVGGRVRRYAKTCQRIWDNYCRSTSTLLDFEKLVEYQLRVRLVGRVCLPPRPWCYYGQFQFLRWDYFHKVMFIDF